MRTERRCVQRRRPGGVSYFEFEAGSGGIVLDASEKGLRFQAADAVHQLGRSRIWISPRPEERIELTGDVVWTDQSRKTGGLRFIETGTDSTRKIRMWLGQPRESEEPSLPLPAWAAQDLGALKHETRHDAAVPSRSTAVPQAKARPEVRPVELHPIPGMPSLFTSSSPWQPEDVRPSEGRIAYKVATGFLVVVLAVAGVVLFDMFRPEVGESLIHLGEKINGSANVEPQNPSPQPSSAHVPSQALPAAQVKPDRVQTEGKPDAVQVQKENPENSDKTADASAQVGSQAPERAIPRMEPTAKEVPNRPPYPRATNSAQDRSAEATRLWSAVASGDSSAEVDLAGLYLRGEGVQRNCEQAKVLLRAAAKNSFKARQQLKKLLRSGCW